MNKIAALFITLYLILFSFLQAQTNTTPCTATRLCKSETLDNSHPTKDTDYSVRGFDSFVTFNKAIFYKVIIKTGSTFTFMIRPNNSSDYDWALWKNIGCNTITSSYYTTAEAMRFSANNGVGVRIWNTGMDISKPATLICDPAGAHSDGIVSALDVAPGDELLLGINQAQDDYKSNYQLVFGGALGGGGNATFICVEEYPNPYYICDVNNDGKEINYDLSSLKAHLITSYLGGNTDYRITFYETEKDVVKEDYPIVKLDITSPKREVFCHITKPNGDLHTVLAINLELTKSPVGANKEVVVCGDKEDLTKFNSALSTTPNTKTLYYKNISDAQNESYPLSMPTSVIDGQKFYAVIKTIERGCSIIRELTIRQPVILPVVENLTLCSGSPGSLIVSNPSSEVNWYTTAIGGTVFHTGSSYPFLGAVNTGTSPIIRTYYVENKSGECISNRTKVTITINSTLPSPTVSDLNLCSGVAGSLTVSNPSTEVNWYTTATGGTAIHTGNTFPFAGELNTGTAPIVHTYYVENKSGDCLSERTKVTITINSTLPSPTVSDLNLCSGETGVLTVNNPSATVNWYTVSTGGTAFYTGSSYTFSGEVNTGIAPIIYTYYVENNSGDCISARVAVTVTVNSSLPKPLIQNLELCSGVAGSLTVSNPSTEVNWYTTETGGTAFHTGSNYPFSGEVNSSTTPIVHTYYVENKSGDCVSGRTEVSVTVMSITPSPKVNSITICSGDKVTLTAIDSKGKVFWYDSNEDLVGSEITFSPTKNLITTTTYTVYQKAENSCISLPMTVTVTVSSITASPIIKSETICSGEEVTLTVANAIANADITWYDDKGTEVGIGIAFTPTGNLTKTTTYTVYQKAEDNCISLPSNVTVFVKEKTPNPIVEPKTICFGEKVTLTVTNAPDKAEITWYNDKGEKVGSGSSFSPDPNLTETTVYFVEQKKLLTTTFSGVDPGVPEQELETCISDRVEVTVTVTPQTVNPIVENLTLCSGVAGSLTVSNPSTEVNWYTTATGGTAIHTGNTFPFAGELNTGTAPIVHTYYVENKSGDCLSERTKVTITINSTLPSPTVSDLNLCSGETGVLTVNNPSATVNWYTVSTGGTAFYTGSSYTFSGEVNTGIAPIIYTYYVENNSGDCISARVAVTVTVNSSLPKPLIQNLELCSGVAGSLTVSNPSTEVNWYTTETGGTAFHTGSNYPFSGEVNSSTTPIVHTYYVENKSGDCVSGRTEVSVTVMSITPSPKVNSITICSGDKVTLTAIDSKGKVFWYDSNEDLVGSEITFSPTKNLITTTTYTVYQKAENSCISLPMTVTVTVSSITASPIIKSETICSGEEVTLTVANAIANADITWYDDKGTEVGIGIAFTPTGNLTKTTTYTVYQKAEDNCISLPSNVTVFVKEKTPNPIVEPKTICFGEKVTLTVTNAPDKAEITWYNDKGEKVGSGSSFSPDPNLTETTVYFVEQKKLLTTTFSGVDPGVPEQELETCISDRVEVTVTVTPQTVNPIVENLTLCSGVAGSLTVSNPSTEVNWYTTATGGTAIHTGNTFPFAGELNTGTAPIVHTYYVENKSGDCLSERTKVTITINSTLPSPTVSDLNLCSGETGVLTVNNPSATVNWYTVSTGGTAFYTGSSYTFSGEVNTGIAPIIYTYYVENNSGDCISARVAVTVTVNSSLPKPLIQNLELCSGVAGSLTVSNPSTEVNWYTTETGGTAFHTGSNYPFSGEVNSSTTPIVHTYYVENKSGDCVSGRTEVSVTVTPQTVNPIVENLTLCSGVAGSLTVSNPSTEVNWYTTETGGTAFHTGSNYPFSEEVNIGTVPIIHTYYVENKSGACVSNRTVVTVTVTPQTANPIVENLTLCSGVAGSLTVSNPSTEVNWYTTETGGTAFHTSSNYPFSEEVNIGTVPIIHTYYVENKSGACVSNRTVVTVAVTPQTPNPIVEVNLESLCSSAEVTLTVTNPRGEVRWYDSKGVYLDKGNSYKVINITTTTTYYVEQEKDNVCISKRILVEIVVPVLDKPKVNREIICVGDWAELEAINPMGTVSWYDSIAGGNLLGSGNTFTTSVLENNTDTPISYFYYVEQEYCHNISERTRVEVTVLPKPKIGEIIKNKKFIEVLPKYGNISDYLYSIDGGIIWQNSNVFKNLEEGKTYSVDIKNKDKDCLGDSREVKLLRVLNFISPNGDGVNDTWKLDDLGEVESVHLRIFNRYGKIVYETTDPEKLIWDGKYLGRPLPTTSYWYTLQWTPKLSKLKEEMSGWIALKNSNHD